jgi:hypothetical protein
VQEGKRTTGRARVALAGVASMALLAGCDGGAADPSPSTSNTTATTPPSPTSSSTPSTGTTTSSSTTTGYVPVKPDFPAAAKSQTARSAEAFVRYFFDLANYAYAQPQAGVIGSLGTLDCKPCQYYEKEASELARDGRRYQSAVLSIKSASTSTTNLDRPWVTLSGRQNEVPIVEPNGQLTSASPASPVTFRVLLKWTDAGWRVQNVVDV